ncbi:MAG: glycogen synthase GlgA [Ruminococcaceae bacterium]|nr:glycogen synthase GlgA [Oscillospiraceae bacterium]
MRKQKILFVASEAVPYASSGGLGDVIGSLPAALCGASKGELDVRVIMPLYGSMKDSYREALTKVCETYISLSWRRQYLGIYKLEKNGVIYYFLDNEYYFKRPTLYGSYDDGERYAFFCRAVMESLPIIDFFPDVLHAHDWQSALTVIYLKRRYANEEGYKDIKTVFTIHNIAYQGVYGHEILGDVFDLGYGDREIVDYNGAINLMKGAIVCADTVSTVSPTYALEILSPRFSNGLHYVLEQNKGKLRGILNGIDTDYYNPVTDTELFANYSSDDLSGKAVNKKELQKLVGLEEKEDIPVVAIISRLTGHKGIDIVMLAAEELLKDRIQLVVLGQGDYTYENYFWHLADSYKGKVSTLLMYNKDMSKKIYAGADIFLMPSKSEPCGLAQMIASRYGTVPVVRETGGLYDSIKDVGFENGNGFTFAHYSSEDLIGAVRRAVNAYNDKENYKSLVKKVMEVDFSWDKSALDYIKMYKELLA